MFVVLETYPVALTSVVTDDSGETKVFDTFDDADDEASECQRGIVVRIPLTDIGY